MLSIENALLRYSRNSDEYAKHLGDELRRLDYRVALSGASDEEKEQLSDELFSGSECFQAKGNRRANADEQPVTVARVIKTDFYKVFFTEVLDLVAARKVFVKDGFAYVPQSDFISIMIGRFRSILSLSLTAMLVETPGLAMIETCGLMIDIQDKAFMSVGSFLKMSWKSKKW
ncbi:unnamed protein product [Soboliphyme baturini]|uniref:Uncharacterized protein n=1 Tax=Soboliphyme baturini TaxID=241478 RepID=A0A3P8B6Y3_9BILA|nr:unnamed protein product [Soboliphyme baturini]